VHFGFRVKHREAISLRRLVLYGLNALLFTLDDFTAAGIEELIMMPDVVDPLVAGLAAPEMALFR